MKPSKPKQYKEFLCIAQGLRVETRIGRGTSLQFKLIKDGESILIRGEIKTRKWHVSRWEGGEIPPSMIATQSLDTVFPDGEIVWKANDYLSIWQTKEAMLNQLVGLERVAKTTNNYSFWAAALVVADNLILMLTRQGKIDPTIVAKSYSLFEKTRNLAIGTNYKGEQIVAANKALHLARTIVK
jgi:hypothetical protein